MQKENGKKLTTVSLNLPACLCFHTVAPDMNAEERKGKRHRAVKHNKTKQVLDRPYLTADKGMKKLKNKQQFTPIHKEAV